MRRSIFPLIGALLVSVLCFANTDKYRGILNNSPATTFTIAWNQIDGNNPVVYFDVIDHGTNWQSYANNQTPDKVVAARGMQNNFVRLTGLQPNTAYYFVIKDSNSTSARFWFKTAPDVPNERLSIIAGGDSRNNRTPRQKANLIVSKLRPHVVMFGGDMTDDDTTAEWIDWMDDWQLTIGSDGRIIPIVAARGNHEYSNAVMLDLFDSPSPDIYYSLSFGGTLLKSITLNSLISSGGNQAAWLETELQNSQNFIWRTAQYHFPIIPHNSGKLDNLLQRQNWAPKFDQYDVQLSVECDAHMCKSTYPIRLAAAGEPNADKGFVRDDNNGTVYVGEGAWGAPLRANNDDHLWTRASGSFNQVKWIFVDEQQIKIRTIKVDNAATVGQVNDSNIFLPPANLDIWNPATGSVICIENPNFTGGPDLQIINPLDGALIPTIQNVFIATTAVDNNGSVDRVDFYVNGNLVNSLSTPPFNINWLPPASGPYEIKAVAFDNDGYSGSDIVNITVAGTTSTNPVSQSSDDAEENQIGVLSLSSSDLELVNDGIVNGDQQVGIRFNNISVPVGATITNAYIQFTAKDDENNNTNLDISVEMDPNPATFSTSLDVSDRTPSPLLVSWAPAAWTNGANGVDQQTPDLSPLLQTVVDMSGWSSGNSAVFLISGSGQRRAYSYDQGGGLQPVLHVNYQMNLPPITGPNFPANQVVCGNNSLVLDAGAGFSQYFWNGDLSLNQGQFYQVASFPTSVYVTVMDQYGQQATSITTNVTQSAGPTVNLGADVTICSTCNTTLDAGAGYASYLWSNAATTQTITVSTQGIYSVTVTDSDGCTAEDELELFVLPPITAPTLPSNQVVCGNDSLQLDAGAGFTQYYWNGNLTPNQGQYYQVTSFPATVFVIVEDQHGQQATSNSVVVTQSIPTVNLGQDQTICSTCNTTLDAGAGFASYLWSNSATTQTITVSTQGIYSVTVTDSDGCTAVDELELFVLPPITAPTLPSNQVVCGNDSLQLDAGAGFTQYYWNGNLTPNQGQYYQVTSFPASVYVIVEDQHGQQATSNTITVTQSTPTVTLGPDITICTGCNATLDAGAGFASYLWSNSATTQTITVSTQGIYSVTVTNSDGCVADDELELFVLPPITAPSFPANQLVCGNDPFQLDAGPGFAQYYWNGNLAANQGRYYQVTSFPASIYVIVEDQHGQQATSNTTNITQSVPTVNLGADITICGGCNTTLDAGAGFASYLWSTAEITQTITVTTQGIYSVTVTDSDGCTAEDDLEVFISTPVSEPDQLSSVRVYPNPTDGEVFIQLPELIQSTTVRLFDMNGKVIVLEEAVDFESGLGRLSLQGLSSGVYYLQMTSNGQQASRRILLMSK